MSRKRTNLDRAEADYLYATVLIEANKYKAFQNLTITERNNLIDKICIEVLEESCKDREHIEAVTKEILSYRLTTEEEKTFYNSEHFIDGVEKPKDFDLVLEKKYYNKIVRLISSIFNAREQ